MIPSHRRNLATAGAAAVFMGAFVAPATAADTATQATATAASTVPQTAESVLASMTLAQRVGQMFMVGTPATSASSATLNAITDRHVGNVMLTGRSYGGTATPARVAGAMQARTTRAATGNVDLFVATDQEGGQVQVLNGTGISDMPSALQQGRWTPARLHSEASTWARQLRAAGVNMDLAPVVDTVPSAQAAQKNPPIGAYDREFGYTTSVVGSHGRAFMSAMDAGGVAPSVKHFPGLGRVHANTDTKNPAAFSPFIINTVLRGDLGFSGVVISDDLANARQVSRWSWGQRAVKFVRAGGNVVLTVNPASLPAMYAAVLTRAKSSPAFRAQVKSSALKVLQAKEARHLL